MTKDDLLNVGVLLESSKIVKEDHLEGSRFTNAGYEWKVLGQKGEYTLVHAPLKRFQPYVVAWNLSDDGSWGQGHYFNDEGSAKKYFNKVTKSKNEAVDPLVDKVVGEIWTYSGPVYNDYSETPITVLDGHMIDGATTKDSAVKLLSDEIRKIVGRKERIHFGGTFTSEPVIVRERQKCPECGALLNDDGGCIHCDNGPLL